MSSPAGSAGGGAPAAIAFSAYFRPQNVLVARKIRFSCPKYKFHFEKVVVTVTTTFKRVDRVDRYENHENREKTLCIFIGLPACIMSAEF